MTLRRPAAHLRRPQSWRRSGDESYWESLVPEGEVFPQVSRPQRAPRPQSAIEGGRQLDGWLEHLQRIESELSVNDQVPAFSGWTSREPSGSSWRQRGIPSYSSRASSSCGTPSLYEGSVGSQESLQTGFLSPSERRGSWERAHMSQAPRKEQAQLSSLAPVKIGWLPIQRRVMMLGESSNQNQLSDHSTGQVKLKQAITPTFLKNRATTNMQQDEDVEKSHTGLNSLGVKTWKTPDQDSPCNKQVPEKPSSPAKDGDRSLPWQFLRRGWNTNRVLASPGGSQSKDSPKGTSSNSYSSQMKTTSIVPFKEASPHGAPVADKPHALLQRNSTDTNKTHTALHRTGSVQPLRATVPLCRTNSISQPSHIQTTSAVTTLIPQNKAGFSSITISSRKVSRSASLPDSDSPFQQQANQNMDPKSRQVTVQRKATIVKVTEQRTMSSPAPNRKSAGALPASHALDTVVHRRKATIIKVTEHRESYSPGYRHSYTDGVSRESQGNHSAPSHHPTKRTAVAPNTSDPEKKETGIHRSTLSLFVSNSPAIAAPVPREVPPKAVGSRSNRPGRPQSCYGNMFGHTEPSQETATQPAARKWSFGFPQGAHVNPANSGNGFVSRQASVKEAGQLVADCLKSNGGQQERVTPENTARRASPCLTLIKAPDPHQSQEEVLALNAAAIIANIKLQRQLSKKKPPNGNSEKAASLQGNTVTDEGECMKPHPDQRTIRRLNQTRAAFETQRSPQTISLQEALQSSRPDFISRSQGRLRELEQKAQERRDLATSAPPRRIAGVRPRRPQSGRSTSQSDNLFKPRDRAITGKEMPLRSKRTHAEVKGKKEEEKKREACLSNRQKVELFKKRLLDQLLQRSNS